MKRLEIGCGDRKFLLTKQRPPEPEGNVSIRLVDLFSGCGGFSLGIMEACRTLGLGFEVALAVESNPAIFRAYADNFAPLTWTGPSRVEDWFDAEVSARTSPRERTTTRRLGAIDILIGGPPCQGHSTLNNHTRGRDPKNGLYLRMIRAAEVLQPSRLIIENVPAVERDEDGVLDTATRRLEQLGYHVEATIASVSDIGVPQLRKRHILTASVSPDADLAAAFERARVSRVRTLRWAIGDLAQHSDGFFDTPPKMSPDNLKRARWLLQNNAFDLPNSLRPRCHRDKPNHKYKSMYGRLRWTEPAQTITTGFGSPGQGRYLHPDNPRTITPHEAARLQFFPDWFSFRTVPFRLALAECIGNAVPVKLGFVAGIAALSSMANVAASRKVAQGGF